MTTTEDIFHLGIKALVRNQAGHVLLLRVQLRQGTSYWDLPGGRVQQGELPEQTLRREVQEEIGVSRLTVGQHLGMVLANVRIPLASGGDVGLILSIYSCTIPADVTLGISGEHTTFAWCEPAEAAKRLATKLPAEFCQRIALL